MFAGFDPLARYEAASRCMETEEGVGARSTANRDARPFKGCEVRLLRSPQTLWRRVFGAIGGGFWPRPQRCSYGSRAAGAGLAGSLPRSVETSCLSTRGAR